MRVPKRAYNLNNVQLGCFVWLVNNISRISFGVYILSIDLFDRLKHSFWNCECEPAHSSNLFELHSIWSERVSTNRTKVVTNRAIIWFVDVFHFYCAIYSSVCCMLCSLSIHCCSFRMAVYFFLSFLCCVYLFLWLITRITLSLFISSVVQWRAILATNQLDFSLFARWSLHVIANI